MSTKVRQRMKYYILGADGRSVREASGLAEWCRWMGQHDARRRVAAFHWGNVIVSTVFMGVNLRVNAEPPMVFETIVAGGTHDGAKEHYTTFEAAEAGHRRWIERVKGAAQLRRV